MTFSILTLPKLTYRKEIDGLRAIAVIPVLLFHADFQLFSGGYVGVDVFFVISGYLITSIIFNEIETGRFSIIKFYERRARRILPALYFVTLVTLPFVWYWFPAYLIHDFAKSIFAVATFSSNVLFWLESGYFDIAASQKPLLHTWSLAVEEQYYIVYPLLILLIWTYVRSRVVHILIAILIASLMFSEWGWREAPSANFYLLPGRAWELTMGALVALYLRRTGGSIDSSNPFFSLLSATGLALIGFSVVSFDHNTPFPGLYALVPVVGTALVILFASEKNIVGRALSFSPLVMMGLISYSTYLWHHPLFSLARFQTLGNVSDIQFSLLIVLSVVLAYLTWRFIETPVRIGSTFSSSRSVFAGSILVGTIIAVSGLGGFFLSDEIASNKGHVISIKGFKKIIKLPGKRELVTEVESYLKIKQEISGPKGNKISTLILGDSHGADLHSALIQSSLTEHYYFNWMSLNAKCLAYFKSSEAYLSTVNPIERKTCNKYIENMLKSEHFRQAEIVIYSPQWMGTQIDFLPYIQEWMSKRNKLLIVAERTAEFHNVLLVAHTFFRNGGNTPRDFNRFLASNRREIIDDLNLKIRNIADTFGIPLISKLDAICPGNRKSCQGMNSDGKINIHDPAHWTWNGARYFGQQIALYPLWSEIRKKLRPPSSESKMKLK
jgi:peptidoglycan/LPS O-acetylase OafA/YrhL